MVRRRVHTDWKHLTPTNGRAVSYRHEFKGTPAEVVAALDTFGAEQETSDAGFNSPKLVRLGHQEQIKRLRDHLATDVLAHLPPQAYVTGAIYGHANPDGWCGHGGYELHANASIPAFTVADPDVDAVSQ